jgi:hypothetical protein
VPTLCLDHLTPEQTRAFRIADNRLTEISTWDDRLLAEQLRDLSLHGLDFTLEATGFEMGEIDLRIASLEEPPERDDRPGRCGSRGFGWPTAHQVRGSVGARSPSPVMRQCSETRGLVALMAKNRPRWVHRSAL